MALAGYPRKLTFHTLLSPSSTGMFSSRGAVLKCSSTSLAPVRLGLLSSQANKHIDHVLGPSVGKDPCTNASGFPHKYKNIHT